MNGSLLFVFCVICFSQDLSIQFKNFTSENGLPVNPINLVNEMPDGRIIIATQDGLSIFNGKDFEKKLNKATIHNLLNTRNISVLSPDSSYGLWINNGIKLSYYSIKKDSIANLLNQEKTETGRILLNKNGKLWYGTNQNLYLVDKKTHQLKKIISNISIEFNGLFIDSDNDLWCITSDSVRIISTSTYRNKVAKKTKMLEQVGFQDIRFITQTTSNDYIITNRKIVKWISQRDRILNVETVLNDKKAVIRNILLDSRGSLWIGTNLGLILVLKSGRTITFKSEVKSKNALVHNRINHIYEDQFKVIWVSTFGGLSKIIYSPDKHFKQIRLTEYNNPYGVQSNVYSISEDRYKNVWFGTFGDGIFKYDKKTQSFTQYSEKNGFIGNTSLAIFKDINQDLWVGTENGVSVQKKEKFRHFYSSLKNGDIASGRIHSFFQENRNVLWIGRRSGLSKLNLKTFKFTNYKVLDHIVNVKAIKKINNFLWLGTNFGVIKFDLFSEKFEHIFSPDGQFLNTRVNSILCMEITKNNQLWLGTNKALISYDITTGQTDYYNIKDGFNNDYFYAILKDSLENLWLSTNSGLSKFNPYLKQVVNYTIKEGLSTNEFNSYAFYKSNNSELYFGTPIGITYFHPNKLETNKNKPHIIINQFKINGEDVLFSNNVTVDYESDVEFRLNIIENNYPNKNKIKYKLIGNDTKFIISNNYEKIKYSNLKAGNYYLDLYYSNGSNLWFHSDEKLYIVVKKPFWQKWYFILLTLCIIIILIKIYISYKNKRLMLQKRILKERVNEKTKELTKTLNQLKETQIQLIHSEKMSSLGQMVAGVAHEINTPLAYASNNLNVIDKQIANIVSGRFTLEEKKDKIQKAINQSKIGLKNVTNIVQGLRRFSRIDNINEKENVNIANLLDECLLIISSRFKSLNISLILDIDTDITLQCSPTELSQMFINFMNNAVDAIEEKIKKNETNYTPEYKIEISQTNSEIHINLTDNADGMNETVKNKIFDPFFTTKEAGKGTGLGMSISYKIIKSLNGSVSIDSKLGQGTTFNIRLMKNENITR